MYINLCFTAWFTTPLYRNLHSKRASEKTVPTLEGTCNTFQKASRFIWNSHSDENGSSAAVLVGIIASISGALLVISESVKCVQMSFVWCNVVSPFRVKTISKNVRQRSTTTKDRKGVSKTSIMNRQPLPTPPKRFPNLAVFTGENVHPVKPSKTSVVLAVNSVARVLLRAQNYVTCVVPLFRRKLTPIRVRCRSSLGGGKKIIIPTSRTLAGPRY